MRVRGERMSWVISFVLVFGYLGRSAVLALPHEVVARPGTTDALSLRLFVTKSESHRPIDLEERVPCTR